MRTFLSPIGALAFILAFVIGCDDTGSDQGAGTAGDTGVPCELCGSECPDPAEWPAGFVCIAPGAFTMGTDEQALPRDNDETEHPVELTQPFFLAIHEVTQREWSTFFPNPSWHQEDAGRCEVDPCGDRPVERVNWYEAIAYLNAKSARDGLSPCYETTACNGQPGGPCADDTNECLGGYICQTVTPLSGCNGYRLPTESEWEYAARGEEGRQTYGVIDDIAWYFANARLRTHPVGLLRESPNGIFDLFGNVNEWVWDRYARDFGLFGDFSTTAINPRGGEFEMTRVTRGGAWNSGYEECRASNRENEFPGRRSYLLGFRAVRNIPPSP